MRISLVLRLRCVELDGVRISSRSEREVDDPERDAGTASSTVISDSNCGNVSRGYGMLRVMKTSESAGYIGPTAAWSGVHDRQTLDIVSSLNGHPQNHSCRHGRLLRVRRAAR